MLEVSAGTHKIRIGVSGEKPFQRQLDVLKDSKVTLHATLKANQ